MFRPGVGRAERGIQQVHREERRGAEAERQAERERKEARPGHSKAPERHLERLDADPPGQQQKGDRNDAGRDSRAHAGVHRIALYAGPAPCVATYTAYSDWLAAMNSRLRSGPPKQMLPQTSGSRMRAPYVPVDVAADAVGPALDAVHHEVGEELLVRPLAVGADVEHVHVALAAGVGVAGSAVGPKSRGGVVIALGGSAGVMSVRRDITPGSCRSRASRSITNLHVGRRCTRASSPARSAARPYQTFVASVNRAPVPRAGVATGARGSAASR
jgi:hypothetical protein